MKMFCFLFVSFVTVNSVVGSILKPVVQIETVKSVHSNAIKARAETVKPRQLETVKPRQTDDEVANAEELFPDFGLRDELMSVASERAGTAVCNGAAISLLGTTATDTVTVMTPNFPSKYPNNIRCVYSLSVPANSLMVIRVPSVQVECPYDNATFAINSQPPILSLCPNSFSPNYKIAAQNSSYIFKVNFVSDDSIRMAGFKLSFWLDSTLTSVTTTAPLTTTTTKAPTTSTTAGPVTTTTAGPVTTTTKAPTTTTTPLPAGTCTCGRWGLRSADEDEGSRIVGGAIAAPNTLPYQVGIWTQNSANPFCGGTLISKNNVLTAAHCTAGMVASQIRVAVGDSKYTVIGDGEKFINVAAIINHPNYNSVNEDNDFSILRLAAPVTTSLKVGIACLPPDTIQTFAGTLMIISGWGTTTSGGSQSPDLLYAHVTGLANSACAPPYATSEITANMICATGDNFTKDTCQGDSGGPMVATVNNKITLVGVTSWGSGCAASPYPGVYARVSSQKAWILANSDAGTCQN